MRENKNPNNKENHGVINSASKKEIIIVGDSIIKHGNRREVSRDNSIKIRFKIRVTLFKKLERLLLPLKKSMLTMKYTLLFQVLFTAMMKTLKKKLKMSTESWIIYVVRVKGLSSLIIIIFMVHALIEANYTKIRVELLY